MLLAQLLIVALSLLLQGKYFPEKSASASVENELDTLSLPVDHPELVLARRAMSAHGLCPSSPSGEKPAASAVYDSVFVPPAPAGLASNCF